MGAGGLFRYRLSSAPQKARSTRRRALSKIGESHQATNLIDVLLQVPIIMLLLLGVAFLTAFYVWLSSVEREFTKTQI